MWLSALNDRMNETNERLRVIESDISAIQKYVGVLATPKVVWGTESVPGTAAVLNLKTTYKDY